eukprot:scaffold181265_cov31-Tisochrysis_lutea.AAC.2
MVYDEHVEPPEINIKRNVRREAHTATGIGPAESVREIGGRLALAGRSHARANRTGDGDS